MDKPKNPYRRNTLAWRVLEGKWEDRTVPEMAEELLTDAETLRHTMYRIKRDTGYIVAYKKRPKGRRASELYWERQVMI